MRNSIFLITTMILGWPHLSAQTYNPEAAIDYAETWWNGRNTGGAAEWGSPYNNYENYGGDCANFVSQCLRAGGLNLSAGANGNGLGVDNRNCITGVKNLVTHLKEYQDTEYQYFSNSTSVAVFTDAGDPVFLGYDGNDHAHSLFCVGREGGNNVYNAHTSNVRHVTRSFFTPFYGRTHYFHIQGAFPRHCYNCKQDFDETGIDCGGPCPPCTKAKSYVNYTSNTSSLPAVSNAVINITAGNAQVRVLSQQHVEFISAESIDLLDGFHAEEGSDFSAQVKRLRVEATADCNAFCDPEPYNFFHYSEGFRWEIANATGVHVTIYQYCSSSLRKIYEATLPIEADGWIVFWDLVTNVSKIKSCDQKQFRYELDFTTCQGAVINYAGWLVIADQLKSSTDEPADSLEDKNFQEFEFSLQPNPNTGTFSIETNRNLDEFSNLQIINNIGQTVYELKSLSSKWITLPSEIKGSFVVRIMHGSEIISKRIIVQD